MFSIIGLFTSTSFATEKVIQIHTISGSVVFISEATLRAAYLATLKGYNVRSSDSEGMW